MEGKKKGRGKRERNKKKEGRGGGTIRQMTTKRSEKERNGKEGRREN